MDDDSELPEEGMEPEEGAAPEEGAETDGAEDVEGEILDDLDEPELEPEPEEEDDGLPVAPAAQEAPRRRGGAVMGVPIEVMISVGKARPLISDLVNLHRDSVLPLDSKIEDPVEVYVGEKLIARGELQEMDDDSGRLGVRLTEVADLSNGV